MSEFIQRGAVLQNQFTSDVALVNLIQNIIPSKHLPEVTDELTKLGERVITDVLAMAKSAEAHPPELVNFDSWGNRIDEVIVNRGWTDLHKVSDRRKNCQHRIRSKIWSTFTNCSIRQNCICFILLVVFLFLSISDD